MYIETGKLLGNKGYFSGNVSGWRSTENTENHGEHGVFNSDVRHFENVGHLN